MNPSMLQLKHYHFTAFSLQSRATVADVPRLETDDLYPALPAEELAPQVSLAEPDTDDPREFAVAVKLEYTPPDGSSFPYCFLIEAEGLFTIAQDGAVEERRKLVAVNGASILYGAMREHLLTVSARHQHGPVLLPCLDFRGFEKQEDGKGGIGAP